MKNIKKITVTPNQTIKDALKIISSGEIQVAIVINKNRKLLGTLTDGDIRRGLLNGLDINSSIEKIYFKKSITINKKISKEKILKIAITNKINQIPVIDNKGRLIDVKVLKELINSREQLNKVVIMAGGKGTRLWPLTKKIPKPMLKVGDKPILQTIIEKFKESGYVNFIICVNYKSSIITNYFGNGSKFDVKIEYVKEKKKMGTAGALSLIKADIREPFFVINGDLLVNLNFRKLLDFHNEQKSDATMCVSEYNINSQFGELKINKGKILSINEKPKHKFFINTGIYLLDSNCLKLVPKKFYDMTTFFKKIINNNFKVNSFPLGEYWLDIGRLNDFKKLNEEHQDKFLTTK